MGHSWSDLGRNNHHRPLLPLSLPPSSSHAPNPPSSSSSIPQIPIPHSPPRSDAFTAQARYREYTRRPYNPYTRRSYNPFIPPNLIPQPMMVRPTNPPFNPYQDTELTGSPLEDPTPPTPPPPPPPPQLYVGHQSPNMPPPLLYVDHESPNIPDFVNVPEEDTILRVELNQSNLNSCSFGNLVNIRKDTVRVELDENNPNSCLVSFTFDAVADGSFTISYFAKEGDNHTFTPLYPEIYVPVTIPFQKGLGQKFRQLSGTGIDQGFFDVLNQSNPWPNEDMVPLVIYAETCSSLEMFEQLVIPAHITKAVLEKNDAGHFQVTVVNQFMCHHYNHFLYDSYVLYGMDSEECNVCRTKRKDRAVLPCGHVCMCSDCAIGWCSQSATCPICRQPIEELLATEVKQGMQFLALHFLFLFTSFSEAGILAA